MNAKFQGLLLKDGATFRRLCGKHVKRLRSCLSFTRVSVGSTLGDNVHSILTLGSQILEYFA